MCLSAITDMKWMIISNSKRSHSSTPAVQDCVLRQHLICYFSADDDAQCLYEWNGEILNNSSVMPSCIIKE